MRILYTLIFLLLAINIQAQNNQTISSKEIDSTYLSATQWRNIGPFRGGRSATVTGVAGKPNLYYFGSTGGGVWRTTDAGNSWENISDGYFGGSIGAVAVSNWDNNVIYVGGGEKTVRGNVSSGSGMWKSVDAGKTWEQIGLENSKHIPRVRIHPKNPDLVYAAVLGDLYKSSEERGVYKSENGGKTWRKVLFANADAGAVDLIIDPNNPRILYASTWKIRRTPYSLESGGEGSALWKSIDGGETWKNISENKGLPKGIWGISGITVSPANSNRVYAIIENEKGGVFRSDDGGETWTKINDDRSLRQRAWYYTRIYADATDEDKVFVLNVRYHVSNDGGKTFSAHAAPHGDHHDLWIDPENNKRMIIGDDGGAQVSFDAGENWSTYHNQPTAQFYRVTTDNHFPYRIYGAQQDNSTVRISHRTDGGSIGESDWEATAGGESAHIAVDPENSEIVYGGSYGGFLTRVNHTTNEVRAINVWPDNPMGHGAKNLKYRFQWNFPIFFSPHNSKKLYAASNHLHVTTNEGQTWKVISPDLTRADSTKLGSSGGPITKDNTSVEYYATIFAAIESPYEEGLIWTGSDDGLIHISRDGGESWKNVTPKNMPEWMMINSLETDPFNEGGLYVAGTRYKLGDYQPYLYKTTDYGATWKKITTGIPSDEFTRVVRADPNKKGLLYAGTEAGVYISSDDGDTWRPFQQNLPIVPITDLAVKDNNLIAATQGRSFWMIDDLTPLHQLDKKFMTKSINLFKPMNSYRIDGSSRGNSKTMGTNHPGGVMVKYVIKDTTMIDTVRLEFRSNSNELITAFSNHPDKKLKEGKLEIKPGMNNFNWNMRYPGAETFDGMVLWWASMDGPKAIPGKYKVALLTGKTEIVRDFDILKDPRSSATESDLKSQFDFLQSLVEKVSKTHKAIENLRITKTQIDDVLEQVAEVDGSMEVKELGKEIKEELTKVEEHLYQTKNRSSQDPLNFPIRLNNKLAHLNSLMAVGDFKPTDSALKFRNEISEEIDKELKKLETIYQEKIPAFNKKVKNLDWNPVKVMALP